MYVMNIQNIMFPTIVGCCISSHSKHRLKARASCPPIPSTHTSHSILLSLPLQTKPTQLTKPLQSEYQMIWVSIAFKQYKHQFIDPSDQWCRFLGNLCQRTGTGIAYNASHRSINACNQLMVSRSTISLVLQGGEGSHITATSWSGLKKTIVSVFLFPSDRGEKRRGIACIFQATALNIGNACLQPFRHYFNFWSIE